MSEKRTLLGRDAGGILDAGPAYYEEDGRLIWELFSYEEERDPVAEIKALKEANQRQAEGAKNASLSGEWLPLARVKAREQLIVKISKTFNVELPEPEEAEEVDDPCPSPGQEESTEEANDEAEDS